MYIEEVADAVPGAVAVVEAELPEVHARQRVYLYAFGAFGKVEGGQCNMPFEDGGVSAFLFGGGRREGDAGDVGGAVQVLSAGVHQQDALRADGSLIRRAWAGNVQWRRWHCSR